ncbi:ABC transporter permease/M1 family aminopeptidase [Pontibacter harenae]|uniref:ABC transporter permease/M1 family aminopeptidase n=1 Tax=Pontibacter harenae TaxID=2894083 RepID=UPI001E2AE79E|nr:M1 family aminopeptidase [Pontibacter harenae]MCC9168009.1 ABC transporter permease [Pontibacter harenae]
MRALEIFRFEVYYQLRRPSVWIHFFAVVGLLLMVLDELVEYARTVEVVLMNAPLTVADLSGFSNRFGLLLVAALVGDGAMRDIQARMDPLLYTSSISKMAYLGGRFLGTFILAGVLLFAAVALSLLIGHYAYEVDASLYGPFSPLACLKDWLFLTLPSAFFATALLYAFVLVSRRAMAAYIGGLLLFILGQFSLGITGNWELAELVDSSGQTAISALQRSLTPLQANTASVELKGSLLVNRILWSCISIAVGLMAYARFQLACHTSGFRWKRTTISSADMPVEERSLPVKVLPVARSFDIKTSIYQTSALAVRFFREILMSPAGLTFPVMAIVAFLAVGISNKGPFAHAMLPVTSRITTLMNHTAIEVIVVLLITLFAGQLVWRERDARLNDIADAAPVPDTVLIGSKYLALTLLLLALQAAVMLGGMSLQLLKEYYQLEIGLYLQVLFGFQLIDYLLFAAAAMVIHVLVNQKYVGHLVVLMFYLYTLLPSKLGIEHKLLVFGSDPGLASSVFYGQSAFIGPWILFKIYWTGWAILFMIVTRYLWVRGRETRFRQRFQQAFKGLKRSPLSVGFACLLVVLTGSLVLYNTNILNDYDTAAERIERQVNYERLYGKHKGMPQPHLTGTTLRIELYPEKREAYIEGTYQLKNSTGKSIDSIHVALSAEVETSKISFNQKGRIVLDDKELGYAIYSLEQSLQPGDSLQMRYNIRFQPKGFTNRGIAATVINNGTWISNWEWLPAVGYQTDRELRSDGLRAQYKLPKRLATGALHDTVALYDRNGREWIQFEATIGTTAGQIAVAPGAVRKSWMENGRQYFHYVANYPILNMYHIYSASYKVRESNWNNTALQVIHHPQHALNLDRIEHGMKASLDYFSKSFSPYQYDLLKFVEYPDPGTGGISLPGAISYSTNFALLHPAGDNRGFDLPFAVAAHEVAHQWWGHQLTPADVEGAPFLTEGLAWYSAFGVVEQVYGAGHLQKLLDTMRREFLNPRSRASVPLLQAKDNFQKYRKGPLAMHALREYVGEKQVNQALQNLLQKHKSGEPPFATSLDFYAEIKAVTPDSLQYLLEDLFSKNTYWELETNAVGVTKADSGWLVTLDVSANKVQVNHLGDVTVAPMNDWVEIGLFGKGSDFSQRTIYLSKHRIHSGKNQILIQVTEKPEEAGIDPRHLLIDTEVSNNIKQVTGASS